MSNYHAYADDCQVAATAGSDAIRETIAVVRNAVIAAASPLRKAMARRAAKDRVAGLSNHLLADLGYERDWDGSIRPVHGEDA